MQNYSFSKPRAGIGKPLPVAYRGSAGSQKQSSAKIFSPLDTLKVETMRASIAPSRTFCDSRRSQAENVKIFNAYVVTSELGHGTFGTVYAAKNILGERFALKVCSEDCVKYALQERGFLERLNPLRISPQLREGFYYGKNYILAMQLCEQSFTEFARQDLGLDTVKCVFRTVTEQLQKIHALNIIHTDIKMDNYMLARKNDPASVLTIDFSSAIQLPQAKLPTHLQSRYFRSPEILHRRKYSQKIDLWSLGCLFWEIVFKRPLFPAKTDEMLCLQHLAWKHSLPSYCSSQFCIRKGPATT